MIVIRLIYYVLDTRVCVPPLRCVAAELHFQSSTLQPVGRPRGTWLYYSMRGVKGMDSKWAIAASCGTGQKKPRFSLLLFCFSYCLE